MFEDSFAHSIDNRCRQEALSVRDMLSPAPPSATRLMVVRAQLLPLGSVLRSLLGQLASTPHSSPRRDEAAAT
jgi:hypothetical protein